MTASEKLRALRDRAEVAELTYGGVVGPSERLREASDAELVAAREQLLAVVEAAEERETLLHRLASTAKEDFPHPLELDDNRRRQSATLTALSQALESGAVT